MPNSRPLLFIWLILAFSVLAKEKEAGGGKGGIDKKMSEAIDEAIVKGRSWLKDDAVAELSMPEQPTVLHEGKAFTFPLGRIALLGLALLEAGVPASDPVLQKIRDRVRDKPPATTYDAGMSLLYAEAYLRASNGGRRMVKPEPSDQAWMQKTADYLASGCYGGAWTYACPGGAGFPIGEDPKQKYVIHEMGGPSVGDGEDPNESLARLVAESAARNPGGDYDHSNSQYAVLGLKAASLCGVKVKNARLMWRTVVYHFLKSQEPTGPEVDLALTREDMGRIRSEDYALGTEPGKPRARGWNYGAIDQGAAYGAMTAAGMTALLVAQSEVPDLSPEEHLRVKLAVRDALAWIQTNWSVDKNPLVGHERGRQAPNAHYYHLYGLERIGMLIQVRALAGHAWYKEGAEVLLKAQKPDGHWPSAEQTATLQGYPEDDRIKTALALLFLARSMKTEFVVNARK